MRGKHRLCAVKVPARPSACSLTCQEARLSVWVICATVICAGPWGPSPHPWSQQRLVLSKLPGKKAALSPWPSSPCGVQCVSLLRHSPGLCRRGQRPQECQTHADHTGAVEVSKTSRPCLCSPFSPLFGLILSDARSSHEVTPPQTFPLVSMRSLLHLLGLRLFKGAGTVYPRDTPILLLPKQILRQAPSPCSPSLLSHPPPFSMCLYSCLNRAFPGCVFSEGAACVPSCGEQQPGPSSHLPPSSHQASGVV